MRLIDADMLRAEFNNNTLWHYTGIRAKIDGAPTAYDIDKVIEQLEELRDTATEAYGTNGVSVVVAICNAIEIVKGGVEE